MKTKIIYGYYFAVEWKKTNAGYVAYAPGVGGVYEEGPTKDEAITNAYESACAILEVRSERNDPILEDSQYLKVLTVLPSLKHISSIEPIDNGYIATSCLTSVKV
ncbi:MAG: hypothetical protein WCD72_02670 [Dehalococcoidia bacterium]